MIISKYTVYILSSLKRSRTYAGYAQDFNQRLFLHNKGKVRATKHFIPWKVIYTEGVDSLTEAKERERYWKSAAGRRNIKKIIGGSRPTFRKLGEARLTL
ncbi:MAG: GIY-YIG nuclease family protein [Candidatus Colwellbacteria bacterium]|nr:GIY-YIG nuclease family protein [Candidatus Colwellbacteria bacterium]